MRYTKEEIDRALQRSDRQRIFEACGFDFAGKRPAANGEVHGVALPVSLKGSVDSNPSVDVNLDTGLVNDHGGDYEGDLFSVVQDTFNLDFPDALEWIASQISLIPSGDSMPVSVRVRVPQRRDRKRAESPVPLKDAQRWCRYLLESPQAAQVRDYLVEKRGLTKQTLGSYLVGLRMWYGKPWVFFPLVTEEVDGEKLVTHFKQFRFDPATGAWAKIQKKDGSVGGKDTYSQGSAVLYPLTSAKKRSDPVFLCEGEIDALTIIQLGYNAVTGSAGADTFYEEWAEEILQIPGIYHGLHICYDADDAGRKGREKVARLFSGKTLPDGSPVWQWYVDLPEGLDCNDLVNQENGPALFNKCVGAAYPPQFEDDPLPEWEINPNLLARREELEKELVCALYHNPRHLIQVRTELPDTRPFTSGKWGMAYGRLLQAWSGFDLNYPFFRMSMGEGSEVLEEIEEFVAPVEYERSASGLIAYAKKIRDDYASKMLGKVLVAQGKHILEGKGGAFDMALADVYKKVSQAAGGRGHSVRHVREFRYQVHLNMERWKKGELKEFETTGFYSLNRKILGFRRRKMHLFGAESGGGKTSFLLQHDVGVAKKYLSTGEERSILIFTTEMDGDELLERMASMISQVNLVHLKDGIASDGEWEAFERALESICKLNIYLDDNPHPSLDYIESKVLQMDAIAPLASWGVDYLERVDAPGEGEEFVSAVSTGITETAKRVDACCLLLTQLNENHHKNMPTCMPGNRSIRYSRKPEHDAYSIILLHNPALLKKKHNIIATDLTYGYDPAHEERVWFCITKARSTGFGGTVPMEWVDTITYFDDPYERSISGRKPLKEILAGSPPITESEYQSAGPEIFQDEGEAPF